MGGQDETAQLASTKPSVVVKEGTLKLWNRFKTGLAGVALVGLAASGLVAVTSTTAMAAVPASVSNLHPNDTLANDSVLSDRTDGVDSLAHVTAVASTDTQAIEWFACPDAYSGTDPTASGSGCQSEGVDTTPTTPAAGIPGGGTRSAFDFLWD